MEELPVEIVGDILSRIAGARDVVLASMACREWRRAFRDHLRALSFKESDWSGFRGLSGSQMTALMSRTILQTTCLRSLIIDVGFHESPLSIRAMMTWLMHTRRSLRELVFVVDGADPNHQRFSYPRPLSLAHCVRISETGLRALLAASPYLESLERITISLFSHVNNLTLAAPPRLRSFHIRCTNLVSLTFESGSVEHLHLESGEIRCFEFIGKGTLTNLTVNRASVRDLQICDSATSLESIDITGASISPSDLYRLISKSRNLRKLRLWGVSYTDRSVAIDLETVALSCPQLSLLCLACKLQLDTPFPYFLGGSTRFENMVYLKVGISAYRYFVEEGEQEAFLDEFFGLVEGLLDRCPSLKCLVISGLNDLIDDPRFSTPVSRIRRRCVDSNVQLDVIKSICLIDDFDKS